MSGLVRLFFVYAMIEVDKKELILMKTSTKVTIGLSVAASCQCSDSSRRIGKSNGKDPSYDYSDKSKKFVHDKFDGNEKLMEIVDDLSDSDLDSLMGMLAKIKSGKRKSLFTVIPSKTQPKT